MEHKIFPLASVEKFMTAGVPSFPISEGVENIKGHIVNHPEEYRRINYIYLNDAEGRLTGVIPLHKLLELKPEDRVEDHVSRDIRHCSPHTTLEKAASIAIHHDITDLPVVDSSGKLIGILNAETLLKIISKLYTNKTAIHSGISHEKIYDLVTKGSVPNIVRARIPWLVIGLGGGFISATFLGLFEEDLKKDIVLALFIPAVVYLGGAVNVQSETLYIRTLALKEKVSLLGYIFRDMASTLVLGTCIGLMMGGLVFAWKGDSKVAAILAATMLINFTLAAPVAILIPSLLRKLGKDPALGTGPLATIAQDLVSLVVYFTLAYLIIGI